MGMSSIPLINSFIPKVKRRWPAGFSKPIHAINKPSNKDMQALRTLVLPINTAPAKPRTTNQKYSNDENFNAISAKAGEKSTITMVPNKPPMAENTKPAPRAISAWPLSVIW